MSDPKQDGIESADNSKSGKQSASSGGTCDEYGFVVPDEYVQSYRQHSEKIAPRRKEVKDQWNVLAKELKEQGLRLDGSVTSRAEAIEAFGEKTRSCRKLCRGPVIQGIPPDLRPFVWPLMCGVEKARAAKGEHVYPSLLQRCEGKDRNHELELDLDRTFPGHPLLDRESAHGADFTHNDDGPAEIQPYPALRHFDGVEARMLSWRALLLFPTRSLLTLDAACASGGIGAALQTAAAEQQQR
jgi:hypothetical protein